VIIDIGIKNYSLTRYNFSHDDIACGSVWSKLATLLIVIEVETLQGDKRDARNMPRANIISSLCLVGNCNDWTKRCISPTLVRSRAIFKTCIVHQSVWFYEKFFPLRMLSPFLYFKRFIHPPFVPSVYPYYKWRIT